MSKSLKIQELIRLKRKEISELRNLIEKYQLIKEKLTEVVEQYYNDINWLGNQIKVLQDKKRKKNG